MAAVLAVIRRADGLFRARRADAGVELVDGSGDASLDRAWASLARFDASSDASIGALRSVFARTVPASRGWSAMPPPKPVEVPEPPRASAAHPRAFAGTIHKPPKPRRGLLDVRPFLERWENACRLLGVDAPDPFVATWWPGERLSLDALHPMLREALPCFKSASVLELRRLDRLVARAHEELPPWALFAEGGTARGFADWIEATMALMPSQRATILGLFAEGSFLPSEDELASILVRCAALGEGFVERAAILIAAMRRGATAAYAVSGLELQEEFPSSGGRPWSLRQPGTRDVTELVRVAMQKYLPGAEDGTWRAESLFDALGAATVTESFVRSVSDAPDMEPEEVRGWLGLSTVASHQSETAWTEWLPVVREAFAARASLTTTARLELPIRLGDALCLANAHDETRARAVLGLTFASAPYGWGATEVLARLARAGVAPPLGAPMLRALDAATQRTADRRLILSGWIALATADRSFVDRMSESHPKALMRLARAIGAMHPARSRSSIAEAEAGSLWARPESIEAFEARWRELDAVAPGAIPKKLRQHLEGKAPLRVTQRERALRRVVTDWDLVRLRLIERVATRELQRGVIEAPRDLSHDERHALSLLARAGPHRRGLRRLLRRVLNEGDAALLAHQGTREWIARHPRIDIEAWLEGIVVEDHVEGVGLVRLAIEHDPLEVLKMGDYAHSCLALGGLFETDPAGIVLDVNKRVAYARDADGRVVARQLLAISERDELVCYSVYAADKGLEDEVTAFDAMFLRFDRELAARLALPMAREDYEVAFILSHERWDDGVWEALGGAVRPVSSPRQ